MTSCLQVWRFDDGVVHSHVIARSKAEAIEIFDRVMGKEYRDDDDVNVDIYTISGETALPIDLLGNGHFETKTADQWIKANGAPCFL